MFHRVCDVGSQDKIRFLWRHYSQRANSLIIIVDSNDRERIEDAKEDVEVPLVQHIDMFIEEPRVQNVDGVMNVSVIEEQQARMIQKAQKFVQARQVQVIGEIGQILQVMEHRVPVVYIVQMIVEVPQQQFIDLVIQAAQLIDEVP